MFMRNKDLTLHGYKCLSLLSKLTKVSLYVPLGDNLITSHNRCMMRPEQDFLLSGSEKSCRRLAGQFLLQRQLCRPIRSLGQIFLNCSGQLSLDKISFFKPCVASHSQDSFPSGQLFFYRLQPKTCCKCLSQLNLLGTHKVERVINQVF